LRARWRLANDKGRPKLGIAARLLLCAPFILSGIAKAFDFTSATAEVHGLTGLEPAALFAGLVVLTQLGGSALVVRGGHWAWVGAALLACFTLVASVLAHGWWSNSGIDRVRDFNIFWEHMGLIGGLALAAMASGRPLQRT
jgi:uncharacterized membrane protein YphA (DoxX/SURF4 family)